MSRYNNRASTTRVLPVRPARLLQGSSSLKEKEELEQQIREYSRIVETKTKASQTSAEKLKQLNRQEGEVSTALCERGREGEEACKIDTRFTTTVCLLVRTLYERNRC